MPFINIVTILILFVCRKSVYQKQKTFKSLYLKYAITKCDFFVSTCISILSKLNTNKKEGNPLLK